MRDITERMAKFWRTEYQTNHDELTGLPNRILFQDRLQSACDYCKRSNTIAAVFFIDPDGFNVINDTLGYDVGDSLLCMIAERLRGT